MSIIVNCAGTISERMRLQKQLGPRRLSLACRPMLTAITHLEINRTSRNVNRAILSQTRRTASSNVLSLSICEPKAFEVAVDLGHVEDIHHAEIRYGDARTMRPAARAHRVLVSVSVFISEKV